MPRLLLIDDDPLVLSTLNRLIRAVCPGLDVEPVGSPHDAVARLVPGAFDAVLTDRNMPGMSGEDVLARAAGACPGAVRGLLTGDLAEAGWYRADRLVFAHLQKPCRPADLKRGVGLMTDVAGSVADPAVATAVADFGRLTRPAAGPMPYDGRTSGTRWFEAIGAIAGFGERRSASASVLRALDPDLSAPLGLLVGAFEAAAGVDPAATDAAWQDALARVRAVADRGADERGRIADRFAALGRSFGDLAVTIANSSAPPGSTAAVLLHAWGFTAEVVGPLLQGAPAAAPPAPRLDQSPFSFAREREVVT